MKTVSNKNTKGRKNKTHATATARKKKMEAKQGTLSVSENNQSQQRAASKRHNTDKVYTGVKGVVHYNRTIVLVCVCVWEREVIIISKCIKKPPIDSKPILIAWSRRAKRWWWWWFVAPLQHHLPTNKQPNLPNAWVSEIFHSNCLCVLLVYFRETLIKAWCVVHWLDYSIW